jgi:signal transduction histidine kinase
MNGSVPTTQQSDPHPLLIRRPWERRPVVLATSAALFVAVFVLRQETSDAEAGLALLYVFPVILVALELGMLAGFGAAMLATALVLVWATTAPVDLGVVGASTRSAVFVAAGLVAGRFSDHIRSVYLTQEGLLDAGIGLARLGDADKLGELVVDRALELPGVSGARLTIGSGPAVRAGGVGGRPERFPLAGRDRVHGMLEVELRGGAEERAALAMLALQASVALENQRLLERERERVRLRAALGEAQDPLADRGAQLRTVLDDQELERTQVAHELHEGAAQALAAVLFGLDVVERDVGSDRNSKRLADARSQVDATLASLRDLAVSLRPPLLDDIGVVPALERLAEDGKLAGLERVDVELGAIGEQLTPDREAAIYRVVEEAVRVTAGQRAAQARYDERTCELEVAVRPSKKGMVADASALRARVELLGGAVAAQGGLLTARIPLEPPRDRSIR